MIQSISDKYKKHIAYPMLILFYLQTIILPLHAGISGPVKVYTNYGLGVGYRETKKQLSTTASNIINAPAVQKIDLASKTNKAVLDANTIQSKNSNNPTVLNIGGPSSPEASSFKAVGSDNLVNLFTGDFSYSIPLLDVGGYPVNLFYNGGIGMEQEASWVGLGWNINPGTVSRSMRGVPDDFNGEDKLKQTQKVKPNRTWGAETGIDGEMIGIKKPKLNLTLGVSYNNYLGPAFEIGAGTSITLQMDKKVGDLKCINDKDKDSTVKGDSPFTLGIDAKYSSRSGMSISPSLNVTLPLGGKLGNIGAGISTSYNSRTGISQLNISANSSNSFSQKIKMGMSSVTVSTGGIGGNASINFARPSYTPSLTMPMVYKNFSGQIEVGWGKKGARKSAQGQGSYSESKVPAELEIVSKPLIGFLYNEKAMGNPNAVMDFNRLNDAEVTANTPILSATQYNYDVFSIQGEGTGGSIRAYRGDLGFMKDNTTISKDGNTSIGIDIGIPDHYGLNWNRVKTPTYAGNWEDGNNTLNAALTFKPKQANSKFENVYFRSPGETTVTNPELIDRIGKDNLVRFDLEGANANARLVPRLVQFDKNNALTNLGTIGIGDANLKERDKRTQVTTMLTAQEAAEIGVEKTIRNYATGLTEFDVNNNIVFTSINRTDDFRKKHHISEINVLEQTGMRYVYGLPVYNIKQKEYNFSAENNADATTGLVKVAADEETRDSKHMNNGAKLDGYLMIQETPAFASSFLLTGLISPDFVDVTGNGITEDDLGNAVKFDYTKSDSVHKWRTPRENGTNNERSAHFSEGLRTKHKDNKANITYGEREVWYLNAIESKAMVAIFKTGDRLDAKGVKGEMNGNVNTLEKANKRLDRIDLYTKAEIKAKGIALATPLKTVHFTYDYSLCKGTPDNTGLVSDSIGKLTLTKVHFTYYNRERQNKDKYIFDYKNNGSSTTDNPNYAYQASDKWGTYKNPAINPSGLSNADHPFVSKNKASNDEFAAAWSLKRILLPSGGQMEVQYEAKDYAYVQNRKACDMFKLYGLGKSTDAAADNSLYKQSILTPSVFSTDYEYVYVEIPQAIQSTSLILQRQEIKEKYLLDIENEQLLFKTFHNMPDGQETLNIYAEFDDYGVCTNSTAKNIIYFKLKRVDNKSPLSRAAINFLVERLYGQAFPNSEIDVNSLKDFLGIVPNMLVDMKNMFTSIDNNMRSQGKAQKIDLSTSFIRLANPAKIKYGGGQRVKKVIVKDNWNKMTKQYNSTYGQEYDYTTTDKIMGKDVTISSGVASYEPGLGSEENPFRSIVQYNDKLPLATAQYGAIEMPMLDALYPAPGVGYSKVTVRSIHRKSTIDTAKSLRSAIGKQVTEFYTAKEYPTISNNTTIDSRSYSRNSFFNVLYKDITKRKTTSQGFLVQTNDMHGKMKAQMAFSERDEKTPLSYSYHTYKNTGKNGLNDKVKFVHNELGGQVIEGNMGVDMELMTDTREHRVTTSNFNGQLQLDIFQWVPPIFGIFFKPLKTFTENRYRAVACTKLINYHAIEDSVIVMDKGSIVSTKTFAYDAETGAAIVTKTANEFKDPIYNVSYPAHWAYSGVGLAYKNIDRSFTNVNFDNGKISLPQAIQDEAFESGDELYLTKPGQGKPSISCVEETPSVIKLWAYDKNKNTTALTVPVKDLVFMDAKGVLYTKAFVDFRIIRSGKRNNLGLTVSGATCMNNPIQNNYLVINNADKVITASAVEYKEKWQVDNEVIRRYKLNSAPAPINTNNLVLNGNFEQGNLGFTSFLDGNNFSVTTSPFIWNNNMANCSDHTPAGSNMLVMDGAGGQYGQFHIPPVSMECYRSSTINVVQNTNYMLTLWVASVASNASEGPHLNIYINNSLVIYHDPDPSSECVWVQLSFLWNSGNATTANISAVNGNTLGRGNDYAFDDISFIKAEIDCPILTPVEDCSGNYLDKSINPYIKGLIGNFKPYRSYTYYGERTEMNTSNVTAIRKNGYLNNFTNYWNFNTQTNNLVPDIYNTKWVSNSELTKVNSKGQELETKNALDIYTAAQYGFAKNQATAVANNSRVNEMFAESFEDSNYGETINTGNYINNCEKKHINFGSFINANNLGFTAHTGKNVMRVIGSSFSKIVPLTNPDIPNFDLKFGSSISLGTIGPNLSTSKLESNPINEPVPSIINFTNGNNIGLTYKIENINSYQNPYLVEAGCCVSFLNTSNKACFKKCFNALYNTKQYFKVIYPKSYTFSLNASHFGIRNPTDATPPSLFRTSINVVVKNSSGVIVFNQTVDSDNGVTGTWSGTKNVTVSTYLPCGSYIVETYPSSRISVDLPGTNSLQKFKSEASFSCTPALSTYSLGCTYTEPIAAKDSMINPIFSPNPNPNKKMHFSAWVRENCTQIAEARTGEANKSAETLPCTQVNYFKSKVQIIFNDGSTTTTNITPSGSIIEGWQKVEGDFFIPITATNMTMKFINNGTTPNYWDDIRVHPYNANMKSYAYDPVTLRLSAELDENNYATFYEYDEEGQLIRVKKETAQGIKTIKETRSAKQQLINAIVN
jgi:hypothetical protein